MVLKTIRRGRLVRWSHSSAEVKSLKTRVNGTVDNHSNEMAVKAARRGASVLNKRATLTKHLLIKRELDNSSTSWNKGQKAACQEEKTPWIRKSYSLLL
jgi:hypothetical protein